VTGTLSNSTQLTKRQYFFPGTCLRETHVHQNRDAIPANPAMTKRYPEKGGSYGWPYAGTGALWLVRAGAGIDLPVPVAFEA
jgi:hypothetical protein